MAPLDNIAEGAHGMMMNPEFYMVKEELDTELVYQMAKWIGENYDSFKDKAALAFAMDIKLFREMLDGDLGVPIHEWVVRYLKEAGMWTAEDEARQAAKIALYRADENAWKTAIAEADEKKVLVDPYNKPWLDIWEAHKSKIPNRLKVGKVEQPSEGGGFPKRGKSGKGKKGGQK